MIVAKTKFDLRRAIKKTLQVLERLGLQIAKEKTAIGKLKDGVTFLGYRIRKKNLVSGWITKNVPVRIFFGFMSKMPGFSALKNISQGGAFGCVLNLKHAI